MLQITMLCCRLSSRYHGQLRVKLRVELRV
jgi:hypothetical protein